MIKNFLVSIFFKAAIVLFLLLLPLSVTLGNVALYVVQYYIEVDFSSIVALILLLLLLGYWCVNFITKCRLKRNIKNSNNIYEALLMSNIDDKIYNVKNLEKYSEYALYIKCKNLLKSPDLEGARSLIDKCTNVNVKEFVIYEILLYYRGINDFFSMKEVLYDVDNNMTYIFLPLQMECLYRINDLEVLIEKINFAIKHTIHISTFGDIKEFLAYCYILLSKKNLADNNMDYSRKLLNKVVLEDTSYVNLLLAEGYIAVNDRELAAEILLDLYEVRPNIDAIYLYQIIGNTSKILEKNKNNHDLREYFAALDAYNNHQYNDALQHLPSNYNNFMNYKLRCLTLMKIGKIEDSKRYMEKLLSSKRGWHWQCSDCQHIVEKYCYECVNCQKLGSNNIIK